MAYLCIGIGYWIWIHSYGIDQKSWDTTGKVPTNWNWVLDWVISDASSEKNDHHVPMYWNWVLDWVTFICVERNHWTPLARNPWIGIGYWIGPYMIVHRKRMIFRVMNSVPMYCNWVLDWVISDGSWTKLSKGLWMVYQCIGIGYWIGFHSCTLTKN